MMPIAQHKYDQAERDKAYAEADGFVVHLDWFARWLKVVRSHEYLMAQNLQKRFLYPKPTAVRVKRLSLNMLKFE